MLPVFLFQKKGKEKMKEKKKNVTEEVKQQIKEMREKKQADLMAINAKKAEAQTHKEEAEARLKEATEKMDLDAYEEAKEAIQKAKTAIDMYSGRYKQISQQEYISEEESDKVIDKLLEYSRQIDIQFKEDIKTPLKELKEIIEKYYQDINETEATIRKWEATIHANYSYRGRSQYYDKEAGAWTDRSKTPVPVRGSVYTGCNESYKVKKFLSEFPL